MMAMKTWTATPVTRQAAGVDFFRRNADQFKHGSSERRFLLAGPVQARRGGARAISSGRGIGDAQSLRRKRSMRIGFIQTESGLAQTTPQTYFTSRIAVANPNLVRTTMTWRRLPRFEPKRTTLTMVCRGFRSLLPTALSFNCVKMLAFPVALCTCERKRSP